jgi:hypothetical protein
VLLGLLNGPDDNGGFAALYALEELGPAARVAAPRLQAALRDEQALARYGSDMLLDALARMSAG